MIKSNGEDKLVEVYLNVYDFLKWNSCLKWIGMDVYHTGVQIGNVEYCYFVTSTDPQVSGIISIEPQECGFNLVSKIYMGETYTNLEKFQKTIRRYQNKYTCGEYNIFSHNCNHFTNQFLQELVGKRLPDKIFKATNALKLCCCCLPKDLVNGQWALRKMQKDIQEGIIRTVQQSRRRQEEIEEMGSLNV